MKLLMDYNANLFLKTNDSLEWKLLSKGHISM